MIEAKKLAYADMLRYVGGPEVRHGPVAALVEQGARAPARARLIDPLARGAQRQPVRARPRDHAARRRHDLSVRDRPRRQHRLADPEHLSKDSAAAIVPRGTGFALHNRGALFTLEERHPNVLAPRKRPLHTIIPAFMEKGDSRIGFGIMGGFNQAQAHAQFVANIVDYGMDIQEALEAGALHEAHLRRRDVNIEALVPGRVRDELTAARATTSRTVPPRTRRVRLWAGGDERRLGRALRRVGAAARRRRDSGSASAPVTLG